MKFLFSSLFFIAFTNVLIAQTSLPLIPYHDNGAGKWGYADTTGKVVIQPKWGSVAFFFYQHAAVAVNNKWGAIDKNGKQIIQPQYDEIKIDEQVIKVNKKNRWGACNLLGKLIVAPMYDDIFVNGGLVFVYLNGKEGYYSYEGKLIVKPAYDRLSFDFYVPDKYKKSITNKFLLGAKGDQYYLINIITGKAKLAPEGVEDGGPSTTAELLEFKEQVPAITEETKQKVKQLYNADSVIYQAGRISWYKIKKDSKCGAVVINYVNELVKVCDYLYTDVADVQRNRFFSGKELMEGYMILAKAKEGFGVISDKGKVLIPFEFDNIIIKEGIFEEGLVVEKNEKKGFWFYYTGMKSIPPEYLNINFYRKLHFPVQGSNSHPFMIFRAEKINIWGFVGQNGVEYFK